MLNPLPAYSSEQNAQWLQAQSKFTAANNAGRVEANSNMNLNAQNEQEKPYIKKSKPKKPLLFNYYETLYKRD